MTNEKDLVKADDELARFVLRPIRGCATDDQYIEALERVKVAFITTRSEGAEATQTRKIGRQALAAELLGHLDRITSTTAAFHFVKNICKLELGQEPDSLGAEIDH